MQAPKKNPERSGTAENGASNGAPFDAPPDAMRLNRFLAQCGLGARRKCDEIIASGHVFVNGEKVTALGTKVSNSDSVAISGRELKPIRRLEYWAYHKPSQVMVTRHDPQGRPTIYDALQQQGFNAGHLNYTGRLDFFSEGLLLLTNDGSLIHALTHPRYQIKKVYQVTIDRVLNAGDEKRLVAGIESEGQVLRAGDVRKLDTGKDVHSYEIDLYEGKNRQVRRMLEALHCRVARLRRTRFASIRLGDLAAGAIRPLTPREVAGLKSAAFPGIFSGKQAS